MVNLFKPLAKNALTPLGLTAAALTTDTGIHKKKSRIPDDGINNFK